MKKTKKHKEKKEKKKLTPKERKKRTKILVSRIILSLIVSLITFYISRKIINSVIGLVMAFVILVVIGVFGKRMAKYAKIAKMEGVFPDFLQLTSSNLRAGITIDRAILLSSRKEFASLDKEILAVGKDIITGRKMEFALQDMSKRINSEKISKTIELIISGMKSGGDIATLLDETAENMRERIFVEKRASSNVLMYVIFIVFAIGIGAPALFGLSSILVDVLTSILSGIPEIDASLSIPISLTSISISPTFILYFSMIFLITTNILGALVLGLVTKGKERDGLKFILPLIGSSLVIFFIIRIVLTKYFAGIF